MKGKKRGRPTKSGTNNMKTLTREKNCCKICEILGLDNQHLPGLCKYYNRLLEIGKYLPENENKIQNDIQLYIIETIN